MHMEKKTADLQKPMKRGVEREIELMYIEHCY